MRSLSGDDQHPEAELRQAIDAFVLTGAVKLYREEHGLGSGHFRHHTMLIHQSVKMSEHRELANAVRALWASAGYLSPTALPRLRQLYLTDLLPVSRALAPDLTTPGDFEELVPYIARTVQRIQQEWADPVIVVNSDKEIAQQAVDFEKRSVWRILVGGTKLSRGFTVEGLTISYYRRTARQADTLMQMGRWFGFRKDYRDLVRLYISRSERKGKNTYDLYEAFEAACLDEEFFRDQLRKYAHMVDGKAQILPRDIPPLVAQHLPWVPPTARNKMFNARLVELRSPGEPIEPRAYPNDTEAVRRNTEVFLPLLDAAKTVKTFQYESSAGRLSSYTALVGVVAHRTVLDVLARLEWAHPDQFRPHLAYLHGLSEEQIEDWAVLAPQHVRAGQTRRTILGRGPLSIFQRSRRPDQGDVFGPISEPRHRQTAQIIAGRLDGDHDPVAEELRRTRRGALLIYPVVEDVDDESDADDAIDPSEVVIAFVAVAPNAAIGDDQRVVVFQAQDSSHPDAPVVEVTDAT